jgi:hypothetical protein
MHSPVLCRAALLRTGQGRFGARRTKETDTTSGKYYAPCLPGLSFPELRWPLGEQESERFRVVSK